MGLVLRQDIGLAETRALFVEGWSTDEVAQGRDFVWGIGEKSSLKATVPFTSGATLSLRCAAWPDPQMRGQRIVVSVNGTALPAVEVGTEWQTVEVAVPDGLLSADGNVVEFGYATHREPGDKRPIAVAWDYIEWTARGPEPLGHVDIGDPSARPQLRSGWALDERGDGRSFVWSVAPDATLEVDIEAGQAAVVLANGRSLLDEAAVGQSVELLVNGVSAGVQTFGTSWSTQSWSVEGSLWRDGPDQVALRSEWVRTPLIGSDPRELGVAWSSVRIAERTESTTDLFAVDAGHSQATPVDLQGGASVAFDRWEGPPGGTLEIVVEDPMRGVVGRQVLPREGGVVDLGIDGEGWQTYRLSLSLVLPHEGPAANGIVHGMRLVNARRVAEKRPNVVLILLDTVRADHLSVYGYAKPTTPRLADFAEHAVVYERAWANSPWTRASIASIWTGLLPRRHGAVGRADALPAGVVTLPEAFQTVGYDTASFVTNGNVGESFGFARGVSSFHYYGERRDSPTFHRPAEVVVVDVMSWARDRGEDEDPFFLSVHLTDPHAPYQPPEPYRSLFAADVPLGDVGTNDWVQARAKGAVPATARDAEMALALYDAEIAYTDAQVGVLLDALEQLGQLEDALVIVTSDHGEEFLEHGGWEHGQTLHTEVLDVPLIVRFPDGRTGREASRAQLIDLFPTALAAAGVAVDERDGVDLAGLSGSPLRDAHASVVLDRRDGDAMATGDLKAIDMTVARGTLAGEQALFNTASDRGETTNLKPSAEDTFAEILAEIAAKRGRAGHETESVEMSDDLEETLRALGYLE
ncbi:MAG: sulfatase [Proteobacteria bacterium]|nr:sulfatase [Pseudomonadota bacterium]